MLLLYEEGEVHHPFPNNPEISNWCESGKFFGFVVSQWKRGHEMNKIILQPSHFSNFIAAFGKKHFGDRGRCIVEGYNGYIGARSDKVAKPPSPLEGPGSASNFQYLRTEYNFSTFSFKNFCPIFYPVHH